VEIPCTHCNKFGFFAKTDYSPYDALGSGYKLRNKGKIMSNKQFKIDGNTQIGAVTLAVSDLAKMTAYYEQVIGLTILEQGNTAATLGAGDRALVRLDSRPNGKRFPRATGLFHLALLVPSRGHLGQWLRHFITTQGRMIDGAGDHLVSEALYLSDPEGNGIEIYQDRPRDTWELDESGVPKMATLAVDLPAVIAAAPDEPFTKMSPDTIMGHIHLQVGDIPSTLKFYSDLLGFDSMTDYPGAGFFGAGGYHHHIGSNTWNSRGASAPPAGSLGLVAYEIVLPTSEARQTVLARLGGANVAVDGMGFMRDNAGIQLQLTVK
jgi:catechol 2,3-dioxygenase